MPDWLNCVLKYIWLYSEVSIIEYVEIVCHYNKSLSKPRIDPRIKKREYNKAAIEELNSKLGKEQISSLNLLVKDPKRFKCIYFNYYYELYNGYKNGILPFDGPLVKQPSKIIEVFNIFTMLELERQRKQAEEEEQRLKRGKR